ncbi:glycosyltransferase [Aerococcaceae bacterium zg-ZJ1578]|uniref:glycosyltransferase n=1 Tax=Aerococcaceae bacterium zg-252 TaxID=2796928 RepID=UPI001A24F884|nr:glycosyltransferase [Aerococcaceae bacterium zg-1578]
MKIVQINSVYGIGSTGKIVKDIHNLLMESSHESFVFYGRGKKVKEKSIKKTSNIMSVLLDILITRLFNLHGFANFFNTKKLIRELENINPDVVHLHNLHGYYTNYRLLFKYLKQKNIPIVWLLHDQWAFSGGTAYFSESINWENISTQDIIKYSKKYPAYIYMGFDNTKYIYEIKKKLFDYEKLIFITPSKWLYDCLMDSTIPNINAKVIYNGIDTNLFKENKISFDNKIKILGVANIWNERKGLKYFNQLARDLDPNKFTITIIGKLVNDSCSIDPRINYVERLESQETLAEYYSDADIFINTSTVDNFPTTILEAQSCGTPVITFDTGGSSESLLFKEDVILSDNYNQLLQKLLTKGKKNEETSRALVNHMKNFDRKVMYENYVKLYSQITGG